LPDASESVRKADKTQTTKLHKSTQNNAKKGKGGKGESGKAPRRAYGAHISPAISGKPQTQNANAKSSIKVLCLPVPFQLSWRRRHKLFPLFPREVIAIKSLLSPPPLEVAKGTGNAVKDSYFGKYSRLFTAS
jgi:hypothetical protein